MTLWVRFEHGGLEHFGALADDGARIDLFDGDMFSAPRATGASCKREEVRLLAPVKPGKFIGLWNNFHELTTKLGASIPQVPLYFLKATSSVIGPEDEIVMPSPETGRVAFEGELGLVIGSQCRSADEQEAQAAIFGVTCINDVTALEILHADPSFPQWARAKSCDTFGPIGPAIATGLDLATLRVQTLINGRERQNYPISDMIIPPARIVSLISREMTLNPGDVIACGTSVGVLPMRPGTEVEVVIDGIGALRNRFETGRSMA